MQELNEELVPNQFKIKESAHAIQVLSKTLYSRPVEAIVRELVCNALDAHKEAGTENKPFEIYCLNDEFKIRDYGTGLPQTAVMELYTTYFHSTKQKEDNYIGSFGLGSKSPFAYTDQFTVVSRYYGMKSTYLAYKNPTTLLPEIKLISTQMIVEDNGLEISFDIKSGDWHKFSEAFQTVLENLEPTQYNTNRGVDHSKVEENEHYFIKYRGQAYNKILCNKVAYRLDCNHFSNLPTHMANKGITFKIPDDKACNISVAPSREELHYDELTKKIISEVIGYSVTYLGNLINDTLASKSIFDLRNGEYKTLREKYPLFPEQVYVYNQKGTGFLVSADIHCNYNAIYTKFYPSYSYKSKINENYFTYLEYPSLKLLSYNTDLAIYGDLEAKESKDIVLKYVKKTRQTVWYFNTLTEWNKFVEDLNLPSEFQAKPASSLKKVTRTISNKLKKEEVYQLDGDKWIQVSVRDLKDLKYYVRLNHKTPFLFGKEIYYDLKGVFPKNTFGIVSSRLNIVENASDWANVETALIQEFTNILSKLSHIKTIGSSSEYQKYKALANIPGETLITNFVKSHKESLLTSEENTALYKYNKLVDIIPESYGRLDFINIKQETNSNFQEALIEKYPMLVYCKYKMDDQLHIPTIRQYIQQCVEAKLNGSSNTGVQPESNSSNDQQEQTE